VSSLYSSAMARVLLATGLFLVVALSGCIGGGKGDAKTAPGSSSGPTGKLLPTTSAPPACDAATAAQKGCAGVNDPKRHYHHYWGDRTQVDIFYKRDLQLVQEPFKGNNEGCPTIGHQEFSLESDGNDANPEDPPVNPAPGGAPNPKADVVFAGTVRIDVTLLNMELTANTAAPTSALRFQYKPANMNQFLPLTGCGIPLELNKAISIPVGPGGADPPHQWAVSRWQFRVWAVTEQGDGGTSQEPTVGQGTFGLQMTAFNGGENSLDPAHPDLWAGSMVYDLGCAKQDDVPRQLVVTGSKQDAVDRPPQDPLADIQWEYGKIVPLKTQKVTGTLTYTYKGSTPNTRLQLLYFGGDTNVYRAPDEFTKDGDHWTFTINDPQGLKADPPYLAQSLWRFELMPMNDATQPDGTNVADFQGSYEICAQAHRDPNAVFE
jgi:hypothetical protein